MEEMFFCVCLAAMVRHIARGDMGSASIFWPSAWSSRALSSSRFAHRRFSPQAPSTSSSDAGTPREFRTCIRYAVKKKERLAMPLGGEKRAGIACVNVGSTRRRFEPRAVGAMFAVSMRSARPRCLVGPALPAAMAHAGCVIVPRRLLGCHILGALQLFVSAAAFNQDIGGWNMASVLTMATVCFWLADCAGRRILPAS